MLAGSMLNGLFLYYMMSAREQSLPQLSSAESLSPSHDNSASLRPLLKLNESGLALAQETAVVDSHQQPQPQPSVLAPQVPIVQKRSQAPVLRTPQNREQSNLKTKEGPPLKSRSLLFIQIDSTPSPLGFSKRDRTRKTWLQYADPRFVEYRFFVSPPSPNHPQGKNALQLLRREQKNSFVKRGFPDLIVRNSSHLGVDGPPLAQWGILWAESEVGLSSRFDFYLRTGDDSMVCLPQLLGELIYRPVLRTGPIFWGKFWCEAGVNIRPEEQFMLFSTDVVRLMTFDWKSKRPLFPFQKEMTLSQNIGFVLFFLNVSIIDDRSRLNGAQDILSSNQAPVVQRRRLAMFEDTSLDEPSQSTDDDKTFEGEVESQQPTIERPLETSQAFKSEPVVETLGSVNSALYTTFCRRKIFTFKPGDYAALNSMFAGLKSHVEGLTWTEGDDDEVGVDDDKEESQPVVGRGASTTALSLTRWQLRSLYEESKKYRETQSQVEQVVTGGQEGKQGSSSGEEEEDDFLKPPCVIENSPTSGNKMLLSQFGAPHKISTVAFVDSTPSAGSIPPQQLASLAFRSNAHRNPFLNLHGTGDGEFAGREAVSAKDPSSLRRSVDFDPKNYAAGFEAGARRSAMRDVGAQGTQLLVGANPYQQLPPQVNGGGNPAYLGLGAPAGKVAGPTRVRPANKGRSPSTKVNERPGSTTATSSSQSATDLAVANFRASAGLSPSRLSGLTPAGVQAKTAAAVDRTLARLGFGGVQGTLQERLELAALASTAEGAAGRNGPRARPPSTGFTGAALLQQQAKLHPPPPPPLLASPVGGYARAQGAAAAAEVVSALSANTGPGMQRTAGGLRR